MLLFLALLLFQQTPHPKPVPSIKPATTSGPLVYLCQGNRSYAYHSLACCEGLA
jgi:hypothetical protein